MIEIIEKTKSLCPECKKELEAKIIEESGSVFMEKQCDKHGFFKVLVSKYAWYYKGLVNFYNLLFPNGHVLSHKTIKTFQFSPTFKCNMHCQICYSYDNKDENIRPQLSLNEIKKTIRIIKGRKIINILGGEPTLREDLPEIIKTFSRAGHEIRLYTNGLKLMDAKYVEKLKKNGLNYVWLWIDSLRDDSIYLKIRGERLLAKKRKILDNLKLFNIRTAIINVIVRGVNEDEIGDIINFARQNHFITAVSIRGYSNIGIGRDNFSLSEEFVVDELIKVIENSTNGLVTLEEFFLFLKIFYIIDALFLKQPQCYLWQHIYIPRINDVKKFREIFPYEKFSQYLNDFENIYLESPSRAKFFFLRKIFNRIIQNPLFFSQMVLQKVFPSSRYYKYLFLGSTMFYTPYTIDLMKARTRCTDAWFPAYVKGDFLDFCEMICGSTVSQKIKR